MGQKQNTLPAPIDRREFMQLCAGSLALATVGCRRGQARAKRPSITVLSYGDERVMGPYHDDSPKFLVFLPLVTRNAKGELEGRLAQSWDHSREYRDWTVHLHRDVRWHDGVPVTAHDIKFTLDLFMDPAARMEPPGAYAVNVLDDSTYTITYHQRGIGNPLDDWTVYYPKHLLEKLELKEFMNWDFWTHPVGNGPYRYVRHVPKTMVELEANPDYYRGKPKIERVVLKFGNPSGAMTELLSGKVDAIPANNRMDVLKLGGDTRFQAHEYIGVDAIEAVFWNQHHPLFRDPKIRRALTLSINRRELHQVLNLPEQTPVVDVLLTNAQFRRSEFPPPIPYDPEHAKRLLDEAGWRNRNGNGVRERDGKPFRFTLLVLEWGTAGMEKAAVYVQAQLRRVGIEMQVLPLERQTARRRVRAGDFEAAISHMFSAFEGNFGPLMYFGERSPLGYSNPKVIALLTKARSTMDPDELDRIYGNLWPILQADVPMTFLAPHVSTTVAHRRIRGLSSPYRADPVWYMEDLWLDEGSGR